MHGLRAGAAVVIRLPYNEKFKDPDFLCEFIPCQQAARIV